MAYPVLKPNSSWFSPTVSTTKRNVVTIINFADSYTPSGTPTDSWDASEAQDGSIMCYLEGTTLTIAGNGSGKIMANKDSSRLFSYSSEETDNLFSALTTINGLPLLDTSNCETMERLFRSCQKLKTLDISNFNTSKVKSFYMAFAVLDRLKSLSVAHLDTSACEDMGYMFYASALPSIDFENWDVSNVKSFDHFLSGSTSVKSFDISKWDVSSCENCNAMFNDVQVTEYDVSNWDVSNVKAFSQMFETNTVCERIIGLENWNTSNGICFEDMFSGCENIKELNLSSFDTRKAHSGTSTSTNGSTSACTKNMFNQMYRLEKITLGENFTFLGDGTSKEIGSLPTQSSTYIENADGNWYSETGEVYTAANVPNLTANTYYAYPVSVLMKGSDFKATIPSSAKSVVFTETAPSESVTLTNVGVGGTNSVVAWLDGTTYYVYCQGGGKFLANADCSYMFSGKTALTSINTGNLDTSNTINMEYMFGHTAAMKLTSITFGEKFNTSNVKNFLGMFRYLSSITKLDVTGFDTSSAVNMERMFDQCQKLTALDCSGWDVSNVESMYCMFQVNYKLTTVGDISNWNVSKCTNFRNLFSRCNVLNGVSLANWDFSSATTMANMFLYNYALTSIDAASINAPKCEDFSGMFDGCTSLATINIPNWDVSNAKTFYTMFENCSSLTNIDVSDWDVSKCEDFSYMFNGCTKLASLDVSNWDVSNAKTFVSFLQNCNSLANVDVSNWDVSNCTNMGCMFYKCENFTSIPIENWDISKVTSFDHMFAHCYNLADYDVSKWQVTSECTNFNATFHSTQVSSIDVSGWDVSNVITFGQMFEDTTNLKEIKGLETWNTSNCIDFGQMFMCSNVSELDLSSFDTRKAKADGTSTSPNGSTASCTMDMFKDMTSLEKITLSENFTFAGDGTADSSHYGKLPNTADGNWYTVDGESYAIADVPNLTARTYYAYPISVIKPNSSWFAPTISTVKRNTITTINIVKSYIPSENVTDSWDASVDQDGTIMCYVEGTTLTIACSGIGRIMANEDSSYMFSNNEEVISDGAGLSNIDLFSAVTAINGLDILDTSNTVLMNFMFHRCKALTTIDVSTFNTSKVTTMSHMFGDVLNGSMALTNINFGDKFVKSTVTDLSYMLYYCTKLSTLDIDDWDISNVVNMSNFCRACNKLTTFGANNLADWDFGNVVYMDQAFRGLLIMPKLALENWNVSKVKNMYCLFCQNEKMFTVLDLSNWNVSNVERMDFMFW